MGKTRNAKDKMHNDAHLESVREMGRHQEKRREKMDKEKKHTPLPWNVEDKGSSTVVIAKNRVKPTPQHPKFIVAQCSTYCGQGPGTPKWEEQKANAAIIVEACNNYERIKQELDDSINCIRIQDKQLEMFKTENEELKKKKDRALERVQELNDEITKLKAEYIQLEEDFDNLQEEI